MIDRKLKIIAALDSFKGAASSLEAGEAVKRGILRRIPSAEVVVYPLGDGGEGTSEVFKHNGIVNKIKVRDTHCEAVEAEYVSVDKNGVKTAVFDMAAASGLRYSKLHGLDIIHASTAGVGDMIRHLASCGYTEIMVGLGGSGTNDAGIGALYSLGAIFYDADGDEIDASRGAEVLGIIKSLDLKAPVELLENIKLTLLYDADVPLIGKTGATAMFSAQKGASPETASYLEKSIIDFSQIANKYTGAKISDIAGAGAAGGLGYGLSLLGGRLTPGAEYILDFIDFKSAASCSDVVITGEGRCDFQTERGKLPCVAAKYSHEVGCPAICLCGSYDDSAGFGTVFDGVFSITDGPISLEESVKRTLELLEKTAYNVAGVLMNL